MARRPLDADRITSPRIGPCAHTPSRNRHMPRNRTTSHGPTTSFFSGLPEFFRGGTRRRHFFHYTAHFIHCAIADLSDGVTTGSTFRPPSLTDHAHWPSSPVDSSADFEAHGQPTLKRWHGRRGFQQVSTHPTTDLIFRATRTYI
jgi:hypothetical protein